MKELYESKISVKRWIVYDVFGNLGWIGYCVFAIMLLKGGFTSSGVLFPFFLMLIGIVELISERIAKLDYVLPKDRLYRGFGALTLGGICGTVYAVVSLYIYHNVYDTPLFWGLLCSGILCAIFAGLLFREYLPVKNP